MSTRLLTASPIETVAAVAERANRSGLHHVVVVHSSGALIGMVCGCDIELVWPEALVSDCMSACALFVGPAATLAEAAELMERYGVGALPVLTRDQRLVGIVSRSDLRRHGFLPDQRGIDRCASCGSSHSLLPRHGQELCFCQACALIALEACEDAILGGEG